jgi:2-polyprenyl-3-methyl-5-hydroxy-6-metoxy-1,4-benzoquinol methylase
MNDRLSLVEKDHWDKVHQAKPRIRLPSRLIVTTGNLHKLLSARIRPGMRVLEIGFAPGKQLAMVAGKYGAEVTGIDYSEPGVETARNLFRGLGLSGDLRLEDIFHTQIPPGSFDFVYSIGVIEHFDDPLEIVACHIRVLKRGCNALILVPNYHGIYGRLQQRFDPDNLMIHNVGIMTPGALEDIAMKAGATRAKSFAAGSVDPSLVNWDKRWPRLLAVTFQIAGNAIGVIQPFRIQALSPWLALEIER